MINLKKLKWSYAFSYGPDNEINFNDSKLIQVLGDNGNGKSSISIILEEVLYNKNSKGFLKGEILNRNADSKFYTIELHFTKNEDEYVVYTKRGSTQSVKLTKNGIDISSHTSTNTYKTIESIIGIDHKIFCQIVCQSHSSSLEFLTSPDTARKKFLIELLDLTKYIKIGEVFKALTSEVNKSVAEIKSSMKTITQWIDRNESLGLTEMKLKEQEILDQSLVENQLDLKNRLSSVESTNAKIIKNNTYISSKNKIDLKPIPALVEDNTKELAAKRAVFNKEIKDAQSFISKLNSLNSECPTCFQSINQETLNELKYKQEEIIKINSEESSKVSNELIKLEKTISEINKLKSEHEQWEKYHQLIDETLPTLPVDAYQLEDELKVITKAISEARSRIKAIEDYNKQAEANNNKIALIEGQTKDMYNELEEHKMSLVSIEDKAFNLSTLTKSFSTTGLVAYKIENLSKDLELLSNRYLSELSDGRFQISFQTAEGDKLNVIITDYGRDIKITALSLGERTRVNIAVLLAIRSLMQGISDARINLLFLDETISTLDPAGKEKLIEVLLQEEDLNTVLVSHEFSHPLLDKIIVHKENKISRFIKE